MPTRDHRGCYAAFKAKDARYDGRFFVGVSSTGIYCRPVCRARLPKAENCSFFPTAAAAEQAGYRPCLLCRPELAPGASVTDAAASLAHRAARLLEEDCGDSQSLEALAGRLGCSGRHLRRAFVAEYKVTPVQYRQTCRLLLAKNLLTDTALPVLEVAMAAGFGSLRRFNALFKAQYRLCPTALRRQAAGAAPPAGITLLLGYRPPYPWQQMLDFLARRAIPGVEAVEGGAYLRTVHLPGPGGKPLCGWLRVAHRPRQNALALTLAAPLLPALPGLLGRVRHLFDLYCQPDVIYEGLAGMNALAPGLCVLGTRLPGCFDAFEMAVRAVLGQQVTLKAASTLAGRLAAAFGTPITDLPGGLALGFPTPGDILALKGPIEDQLGPLGITAVRARAIRQLAQAMAAGGLDLSPGAPPEAEMEKLLAIPGLGPWTARYIAMRAMGWADAFLETDAGVKKALAPRGPKEMLQLAEAWRPWRSYATVNLWNALERQSHQGG